MTGVAEKYLEREIKLDVDEAFTLPDLSELVPAGGALESVVLDLDSRYFDTEQRDLLAARVTLRRREGGATDTGWQLKLPTGDARTELRLPPTSGSGVPKELREVTAGLRRGRPLRQLAHVRVERTAHRITDAGGSVLVEIADDRVRGTRLGADTLISTWREIEVELGAGELGWLRRVEKRLVRHGARPSVSRSKLERAVTEPLEDDVGTAAVVPQAAPTVGDLVLDYLRQQRQALLDGDVELRGGSDAVHHTRVASRRFRSTLRTYGSVFDDAEQMTALDAELRWYAGVLGAVRDPDVLREHLRGVIADLPAQLVLGPVAGRVEQHLIGERERHRAALLRAMNGRRYFALLDAIDRWLADPPFSATAGKPASTAAKLAERAQRKLGRRLAGVVEDDDPEGVHRARKSAKRARYATELAAPALPAKLANGRVKELKQLQDTLGEFQDSVVANETLLQLGIRAGTTPGENGFTYGLLYALEQRRAEVSRRTVITRPG
jgi:CHAD domain-containing protein